MNAQHTTSPTDLTRTHVLAALLALSTTFACAAGSAAVTERALNVDRPSKTDGPFTLEAGRSQVEVELLTQSRNDEAGASTNTISAGTTYLRHGLTAACEVQLGLPSYNRVRSSFAGTTTRVSGLGNTIVRAKCNLWGNDGGATSFALLPFVKVPTCRSGLGNSSYEPGLSLPLTWNLPEDWQLGLMAKGTSLRSTTRPGRTGVYEFSALASHSVAGPVSGYVELWTARSTEADSPRPSTLGLGAAWALSRTTQFDVSLNLGLNPAADDLSFSTGYSIRF